MEKNGSSKISRHHYLSLDAQTVVIACTSTEDPNPPGSTSGFPEMPGGLPTLLGPAPTSVVEVSEEIAEAARIDIGRLTFDGTTLKPFAPPAQRPTLTDIDPRQFFQALAVQGKITQADCLSYLKTGVLPSPIQSAVTTLPADQQFEALCLIVGAQQYRRDNRFVPLLGAAFGMQAADLDALWALAATI